MPWSIVPVSRVSLTVLLGSSTDAAAHSSLRSCSWLASTSAPNSICLLPELSTTSGGVPPLNRGCSVVEISWVAVSLTSASGRGVRPPPPARRAGGEHAGGGGRGGAGGGAPPQHGAPVKARLAERAG